LAFSICDDFLLLKDDSFFRV